MAIKIQLMKSVNGTMEALYPKTIATNVVTTTGTTVENALSTLSTNYSNLQTAFNNLVELLEVDTVYAVDNNNNYLTDDDGTKLVSVY